RLASSVLKFKPAPSETEARRSTWPWSSLRWQRAPDRVECRLDVELLTRLPPKCYWAAMPRLATDHAPEGFEETWEALLDLAGRPLIPAPLLAARALEVTMGADWPVRRAAMEALLRRAKSVDREELAAVSVPPRGSPFGNYSVA